MAEKLKVENESVSRMRIGRDIAKLSFAVLPLMGIEASQSPLEAQSELQAASEVAQRFNCKITAAQDTHVQPSAERFHGEKRTTVQVTIDLETNPAAKEALKRYEDDPSVGWFPPHLVASYRQITPENGAYLETPLKEPGYIDTSKTIKTETYLRTTYPDGARMHLYVGQEVGTADDENWYTTRGFNPCGVLEWSITDHSWSLVEDAPKEQPLVTQKSQAWQKPSSR